MKRQIKLSLINFQTPRSCVTLVVQFNQLMNIVDEQMSRAVLFLCIPQNGIRDDDETKTEIKKRTHLG